MPRLREGAMMEAGGVGMEATLIAFGVLEIDGQRYDHDVVVEGGVIRKRRKGPSKVHRERYGHTPLSIDEDIPWSAPLLIIGTGVSGQLPVAAEVYEQAARQGVEVVAEPTAAACHRLGSLDKGSYAAILHVTC
jgi:hypothetical protein